MKQISLLPAAIFLTLELFAQNNNSGNHTTNVTVGSGIGIGTIIAIVASWSRNHSVLWAIVHGMLGWLYVIYYIVTRSDYE